MSDKPGYRRPQAGTQPDYLHPAYQSTNLRSPSQPLVFLPHSLSEITGPTIGAERVGDTDNDLTAQHEGEPQGERIISEAHANALVSMLETLATRAGMSRSRFAEVFAQVVGDTPAAYLAQYRITLAQQGLLRGEGLDRIAQQVGYGSAAALSRAFSAVCGMSPRGWRQSISRNMPS